MRWPHRRRCASPQDSELWLRYYVDVPAAGSYDVDFVIATQTPTDAIELFVDSAAVGTLTLPDTGSWGSFATASLPAVALSPGPHLLELGFTGGFNLDSFTLRRP